MCVHNHTHTHTHTHTHSDTHTHTQSDTNAHTHTIRNKAQPGKRNHSRVNSPQLARAAIWYSRLWSRRKDSRVRERALVAAVVKYSDQWKKARAVKYHPNTDHVFPYIVTKSPAAKAIPKLPARTAICTHGLMKLRERLTLTEVACMMTHARIAQQRPTLTVARPPGASKMTCRASENHKSHARTGK